MGLIAHRGNDWGTRGRRYPGRNGLRRRLSRYLLSGGNLVADYVGGYNVTGTLTNTSWLPYLGWAPALAEVAGSGPIIVSNDYVPKAYLPGSDNNIFTSPDSVAARMPDDIDIRAYIAPDDWTPGALRRYIISKWAASYGFSIEQAGTLGFQMTDGTVFASTAATGFTDGTWHHVRVTRAWSSGDLNFYTSSDGITWTQLGTTVDCEAGTHNGAGGTLKIANYAADGVYPGQGRFGRILIYSTIGSPTNTGAIGSGSPSVDFNPADSAETSTNAATFVSSTTGETWTLNNTGATPAMIARSPQYLFDGVGMYMKTGAFTLDQPTFMLIVSKFIVHTSIRFIYDGNADSSMTLRSNDAALNILLYAGAPLTLDANAANVYGIISAGLSGASSYLKLNSGTATTGNAGASNAGGITLASNGTPGNYGNIMVKEIIAMNALPSAATLAQIIALEGAIHGIAV